MAKEKKEKPPTKLPPIDGPESVRRWEKFSREAEASRVTCKQVQERLAARTVRTESRPRGEPAKAKAKPKRKMKRK